MRHLERNGLAKMNFGVVLVLCAVGELGWTYVHLPHCPCHCPCHPDHELFDCQRW